MRKAVAGIKPGHRIKIRNKDKMKIHLHDLTLTVQDGFVQLSLPNAAKLGPNFISQALTYGDCYKLGLLLLNIATPGSSLEQIAAVAKALHLIEQKTDV
jgi:hypothetical protein